MTRFGDIQADVESRETIGADDVGWLLDRVTRLETALTKIAKPSTELGYLHSRAECQIVARAALDTEQP